MYEKNEYNVIGTGKSRIDSAAQVAGITKYICDMHLPGMLYAKPVLSTEHHAWITSIDTSAAEVVPGVIKIITGADLPEHRFGVSVMDTPCMAVKKVRYKGEMVACVAAETYEQACRAAELVKVEYERLPAVFDPKEALAPDAPIIHEELQGSFYQGNLLIPGPSDRLMLRTGNVEEGFAQSDIIFEQDFCTCPQKPLPIEPFATLAAPDVNGGLSVWSTQQCVFRNAKNLAAVLEMPISKVRYMAPCVGGAFGEKNQLGTEPAAAVLAKLTGRPVKLELTTEESLLFTGTKHPVYIHMKLGAKKDGTLMALERDCITGAGAYSNVVKEISLKVAYWGSGAYDVPNQWTDVRIVCTNRQIGSAMRGFGMSQTTFAIEVMMDMLAEKLGMDPIELRKKNIYQEGGKMSTGQTVRSAGVGMALDKLTEISGYRKKT